jgi:4-hydroxy-3-polyprenylbenzoate decarboxylase
MSAIGYLVAKQKPSPAILYNNIKGFENSPIGARSLWNVLGPSVRRIALTLGEDPNTPTVELIRRTKDKLRSRIPPKEIAAAEASIYENSVFGDDVNLDLLPIPKHWPRDGGRYAGTADAVITRDPDTNYLNVGTYRMMLQGKLQSFERMIASRVFAKRGQVVMRHGRACPGGIVAGDSATCKLSKQIPP